MQWSSLLQWSAAGAACGLTFGLMSWLDSPTTPSTSTVHAVSTTWTPRPGGGAISARPATDTPLSDDAFVRAAQSSVDAVVHVQTAAIVPAQGNPWLSMLGMDQGRVAQGSGSGVILDSQGWIVTNHHVIDGAQRIQVALSDGSTMEAKLIGSDPSTDLALLKTDATAVDLPTLEFGNSDEVNVGEWVLAVGNPLNLTSTVTAGIVSAKGRNLRLLEPDARRDIYPVESFLQTDAAVNPGNSGGALVNLDGKLVGINTAIASQTGSYAGYSFAIPSSIVRKVVDDLREFGRVQRAYLGIQVDQRDPGVRVAGVFRGSGASEAGLQPGDRIEAIDGIPVSSFPALQEQLSKHRPGARIAVQLRRDGQRVQKQVELQGRAALASAAATPPQAKPAESPVTRSANEEEFMPNWEVQLVPASAQIQARLDIRGGLVVTAIRPGEWSDEGIRRGAVLLRLDGQPLQSQEDLTQALARAREAGQRGVLLEGVQANGQQFYAGVPLP